MRTATITTTLLLAALILTGCAKTTTTTPSAPLPAQAVIAQAVKTFADENNSMVHAIIAARKAGSVAPADADSIESAGKLIATYGLQLDAELRSADPWCTTAILTAGCQQAKLLQILKNAGIGQLNAHISPGGQVFVAALLTAANSLSAALGGPVL